MAPLRGEI